MELNGLMRQTNLFADQLHMADITNGKLKKTTISLCSLKDTFNNDSAEVYYLSLKYEQSNGDDTCWVFSTIQFIGCVTDWKARTRKYLCSHSALYNPTMTLVLRDNSLSSQHWITLVDVGVNKQCSEKLDRLKRVVDKCFKVESWELLMMNELCDNNRTLYTLSASCNGVMTNRNDNRSRVSYYSFAHNFFRFIRTTRESRMEIISRMDSNVLASLRYSGEYSSRIHEVVTNLAYSQHSSLESSILSRRYTTYISSHNSCGTGSSLNYVTDSTTGEIDARYLLPCPGKDKTDLFVGIIEMNNNELDLVKRDKPVIGGPPAGELVGETGVDKNGNNQSRPRSVSRIDLCDQSITLEKVCYTNYGSTEIGDSCLTSVVGSVEINTLSGSGGIGSLDEDQTVEKVLYYELPRAFKERISCPTSGIATATCAKYRISDESECRDMRFSKLMEWRHDNAPPSCRMAYVHVWAGSAQSSANDTPRVSPSSRYDDCNYHSSRPTESRVFSTLDASPIFSPGLRCTALTRHGSYENLPRIRTIAAQSMSVNLNRDSRFSCTSYVTWDLHQQWRTAYSQETCSHNWPDPSERSVYAAVQDSSPSPMPNDPYWTTSLCFTLQNILDDLPLPSPDTLRIPWRTFVRLKFALHDGTDLIEGWEGIAERIGLAFHEIRAIAHFALNSRTTPLDIVLRHWQLTHNTRDKLPPQLRGPECSRHQLELFLINMRREDMVAILRRGDDANPCFMNDLNKVCRV